MYQLFLFCFKRYFPNQGELVHIFATDFKLREELSKLSNVMEKLQNQVNLETYIFFEIF